MDRELIFDIGAFEGQDSEFYLLKGFKVVAVEANPELIPIIKDRNKSFLESGRLIVVEGAISIDNAPVELNVYEYSQWTSIYSGKEGLLKTITIDPIVPSELFQKYGVPYYLKIDIEGADINVITSIPKLTSKPQFVSFEIWQDWRICLDILGASGYRKFQIVEQSSIPNTVLPNPAREGVFVDYKFTHANSGPFGNELEGEWKSHGEMAEFISAIDWDQTLENGWKPWYDLHALL